MPEAASGSREAAGQQDQILQHSLRGRRDRWEDPIWRFQVANRRPDHEIIPSLTLLAPKSPIREVSSMLFANTTVRPFTIGARCLRPIMNRGEDGQKAACGRGRVDGIAQPPRP